MKSICIKKDLSYESIESELIKIQEINENIKLRVPNSLKFSGKLGIEVNLIQLIITCFRLSNSNILHSYFKDIEDQESMKNFNFHLFGICSLVMANLITDMKGNKIKKLDSLREAIPYISAMDKSNYQYTAKGPEVNLISISGAEKEYISALYTKNKEVKSSLELKTEVLKILEYLIGFTLNKNSIKLKLTDEYLNQISLLLHELFINTEEHAKRDFNGNNYSRTISGVQFAFPTYNEEDIVSIFDNEFKEYTDFLKSTTIDNKIRFFELSIFDSGPGYARKWLKKDFNLMTLEEEKDAFDKCLYKHSSTKGPTSTGMGLTIVRNMLNKLNAYMRIRSGRLCFNQTNINGVEKLFYKTNLAQVEGTSISICIPF